MDDASPPRKRKLREEKRPACDECQTHKLRCDAFLDYSRPCSRCVKKQVKCIILEERRKKTPSSEIQNEQSMSSQSDFAPQSEARNFLAIRHNYVTRASDSMSIQPPPISSYIAPTSPTTVESGVPARSTSVFVDESSTKSRTLGNVKVEATMINICFARFNRYYAPLIPILSSKPFPNETFRESTFKFWVIVSIGSRKCLEDPTLFSTLSPHVETLAMMSLCPNQNPPYPIIEALLLMCTWHLSTDHPFYRSIYFIISSAVVTLGLQAGIHNCLSLQEAFSGKTDSAPDISRGAKLWAYAIISNQIAMVINGRSVDNLPPSRHLFWGKQYSIKLPSWIVLQGRITAIVTKAHRMFSDLELEADQTSYHKTLQSLVAAFEAELLELNDNFESECPLDRLHFAIARLRIRSLAFLTTHGDLDHIDLAQLSNAAIFTVDSISELDNAFHVPLHCPDYVFQGAVLAACTLLKLIKGYPKKAFTEKDQTRALFSAINICKEVSTVNNDVPAKTCEILSKLWSSTKIYRDEDGDYVQPLHIRNRLTMSVVFDCLWWWRKLSIGWLVEQPTQNSMNSTQASAFNQHEENISSFNQRLVEESWDWEVDWGSVDFTDLMH